MMHVLAKLTLHFPAYNVGNSEEIIYNHDEQGIWGKVPTKIMVFGSLHFT